jgi:nitroreductase
MAESELYDCLLELVKKRRTVRQFKSDPVPDECITKIIEVARWAPSGFHTQPWEFVVVREKECRDKIIAVLERKAPPIKNPQQNDSLRASFRDAPVFIIVLCDWRARVGLPDRAQESDALVASIFCSSLASTFLYMHLAAASMGLVSQWYSAAAGGEAERKIREIIGIPEPLKIYDMMVLGYAAQTPLPKEVRDPGSMTHYDSCGAGDFRTDKEVEADARKTKAWCLSAH